MVKSIKKAFLFLCLVVSFSFAVSVDDQRKNIIETASHGELIISEHDGIAQDRRRKKYQYEDEVILNWYLFNSMTSLGESKGEKVNMIALQEESTSIDKQEENGIETVPVRGFCVVREELNIGLQPMSVSSICNTNIGPIEFFGNLVPKNELETLFITGLYVLKDGKKYFIENGSILNESKSSYNIATYVNNRKLSQLALTATGNTAVKIQEGANDYLEQVEASKVQQTASSDNTSIENNGSGTIISPTPAVTTNTEKPDAADYVVKGVIDLVTETAKAAADLYKQDLPYLYQVVKGSKFYIDVNVNTMPNEQPKQNINYGAKK